MTEGRDRTIYEIAALVKMSQQELRTVRSCLVPAIRDGLWAPETTSERLDRALQYLSEIERMMTEDLPEEREAGGGKEDAHEAIQRYLHRLSECIDELEKTIIADPPLGIEGVARYWHWMGLVEARTMAVEMLTDGDRGA